MSVSRGIYSKSFSISFSSRNTFLQLFFDVFQNIPIRPILPISINQELYPNADIKTDLYKCTCLELPCNIRIPEKEIRTFEGIAEQPCYENGRTKSGDGFMADVRDELWNGESCFNS